MPLVIVGHPPNQTKREAFYGRRASQSFRDFPKSYPVEIGFLYELPIHHTNTLEVLMSPEIFPLAIPFRRDYELNQLKQKLDLFFYVLCCIHETALSLFQMRRLFSFVYRARTRVARLLF